MAENKFIKRLHGKETAKSVVEIKNTATPTMFTNMPAGDSNVFNTYSDHRGNATGVLQGTDNWKLSGASLVPATTVYGDGRDMTGAFVVGNAGLWIDATYTFTEPKLFTPNTEWVLKLCGNGLLSDSNDTVELTMLIKFGSTMVSKTFFLPEQSFSFSEELVIDFSESVAQTIKVNAGDTMVVQVLCGDSSAHAQIYNGMTVLTALQRRVDAETVASDTKTFDEVADQVDQLQEDLDDLEEYVDDTFVKKAGDTMSGALNIENIASSNAPLLTLTHSNTATYKWNIAPRYNSTTLSVYPGSTETNGYRFASTGFVPSSNDARYLGSASLKWKGVYTAMINNGGDLVVPAVSGTIATKADVDLAANSGRMITDQGVWYAKMYSATVAPSAENGTNYADFSQVDGQGNPIIVIYERQNGAWVQSETITPPAEYDGYVPITSKIWDIAEQAGQQGGRILWNHQSKEFTPYPQIVSFEDIEITGNSTVAMPQTPTSDQIVNKDYVDNAIGNGTITITQGGTTKGTFTTNQDNNTTIDIDASSGSSYHPDLFDWKWADHICNDVQWLRADTFSWQAGSVYESAYQHLADDFTNGTRTLVPEGAGIWCYIAPDGHRIVDASDTTQVQNVIDLYNTTGVAWYYIIDTTNQRFKLPRAKPLNGAIAGNGMTLGFTDGTDNYGTDSDGTSIWKVGIKKSYYGSAIGISGGGSDGSNKSIGVTTDPTKSGIIAERDNTDQHKYLYFYVGEFTQAALENTAGVVTEDFNELNAHKVIAFQAPTAQNNYTWYRKYADGWVEQGGYTSMADAVATIALPITMSDTNYVLFVFQEKNADGQNVPGITAKTTSSFSINPSGSANGSWQVSGMSAS